MAIFIATEAVALVLRNQLDSISSSIILLFGVLVSAITLGSRPSLVTGALTAVAYDYFTIPPDDSFEIRSLSDLIVLMMFPVIALLTGGPAERAHYSPNKAREGAVATNRLSEASGKISAAWEELVIRSRLARHVASSVRAPAIVWTSKESLIEPADDVNSPKGLRTTAVHAFRRLQTHDLWSSHSGRRIRIPQDGNPELGMAASLPSGDAPSQADRMAKVPVDLAATAIVRARAGASGSEVEALTTREKLNNALLSCVSHDFRTPLAVILASASSLRTLSAEMNAEVREDLLAAIQEEAERLNRFVTNLLHMARLEAGVVEPRRATVDVAAVIDKMAQRYERGQWQGRLTTAIEGRNLLVEGDPILLEHALANVVENALRLSPDDQPVTVRGLRLGNSVRIEVIDRGPGVASDQLHRIFEKFYQGDGNRPDGSGAGLGLSIAKGLVEAMHGMIEAHNRDDARGLTVTVSLRACQ